MKPITKWLPLLAAIAVAICGIGCFPQDGVYSHRQRGEEMLLRNTEGRKVPLQTHRQNAR